MSVLALAALSSSSEIWDKVGVVASDLLINHVCENGSGDTHFFCQTGELY